ncbi:MAG: hypothetical protein ACI8PQ_001903 [Planctomycetota bacterium]|jgi:hypothetical protein
MGFEISRDTRRRGCGLRPAGERPDKSAGELAAGFPGRLSALLPLVLLAFLGSCAAPGSDIALAPLWSRASTADGGVEVEAVAGLWRQRFDATSGRFESLTVGPLYSRDRKSPERRRRSGPSARPESLGELLTEAGEGGKAPEESDDWLSRFLVPLGFSSQRGGENYTMLAPAFLWRSYERVDGTRSTDLYTLLGLVRRWNESTGTELSWFPFIGSLNNLFTYEKLRFALWPLFVYAERNGQVSYHMPWPILGWVRGGGESSDHLLPLYSRASVEGRYKRWSFLWPIFHLQYNNLGGGSEEQEKVWWVFPLAGRQTRGTYKAMNFLWPFFGYAHDKRSGFWSWDGPWPLVRVQRGPGDVRRTRFWPIYSSHYGQGLSSRTFLFPLIHLRHEEGTKAVRDSTWVLPFWQSWDRTDLEKGEPTGGSASWRKLFPLIQHEREDSWSRGSFPTLDPFWRNELVDRHYAWLWKIYEWQEDESTGVRRERGLAGLWRRERDVSEDRASLTFLWSRRRYRNGEERVSDQSILFGLLRWRVTEAGGFAMLRPAFPGPGWPARAGSGAAPAPSLPVGPSLPEPPTNAPR